MSIAEKASRLILAGAVVRVQADVYRVAGDTGTYLVTLSDEERHPATCNCATFGDRCSHVLAARGVRDELDADPTPARLSHPPVGGEQDRDPGPLRNRSGGAPPFRAYKETDSHGDQLEMQAGNTYVAAVCRDADAEAAIGHTATVVLLDDADIKGLREWIAALPTQLGGDA